MRIRCPQCSATLKAAAEMSGKKAKCNRCSSPFSIPDLTLADVLIPLSSGLTFPPICVGCQTPSPDALLLAACGEAVNQIVDYETGTGEAVGKIAGGLSLGLGGVFLGAAIGSMFDGRQKAIRERVSVVSQIPVCQTCLAMVPADVQTALQVTPDTTDGWKTLDTPFFRRQSRANNVLLSFVSYDYALQFRASNRTLFPDPDAPPAPAGGGKECPNCGFSFKWDGKRCTHCGFQAG